MLRGKIVMCLALLALVAGGAPVAGAAPDATQRGGLGIQRTAAGWLVLVNLYGEHTQCLDADANGGGNGTIVQAWECNDSPQQSWFYDSGGRLVNGLFSNMCLEATGGFNGAAVVLWRCDGAQQQKWIVLANDVYVYNSLYFDNGNTVLDRDSNVIGNGARVQLWAKNNQPQQWWLRN